VTSSLAVGYFPEEYPDLSSTLYWILGGVTGILFFTSVLLHELGHAYVSLRYKIPVKSITLFSSRLTNRRTPKPFRLTFTKE